MSLVHLFRSSRRVVRSGLAPFSALVVVLFCTRFATRVTGRMVLVACAIAAISAVVRVMNRARLRRLERSIAPLDGGAALVAVALSYASLAFAPPHIRPALSALPFITVACASALSTARAGVVAAVFAMFAEALSMPRAPWYEPLNFLVRIAPLGLAAVLHHMLTRSEVARIRAHAEKLLTEERARQKDAAKSFRLVTAPSNAPHAPTVDAQTDESRRVKSSLEEIRETLVGLLDLLHRSLDLRTSAVFWLDGKGESLRLVEAVTVEGVELSRDPIALGAGAVGGACAMGKPIVLAKIRPDYSGLQYYRGPHGVQSFAAVPVLEQKELRGVVVVDRSDDKPFTEEEQEVVRIAAEQVLRHVQNERVFGMLEKSKDEFSRLFAASRALGEALTEDQVLNAVVTSAKSVAEHDLCVLAVYDEKNHEHRVKHATGPGVEKLVGVQFQDNNGLASAAVKTRHSVPYKGHFDPRTQYVFTKATPLEGCDSVLCLPLVVRDHPVGTLTLAAKRRNAFPEATRVLLGVLASNAAVAMSNAAAVRRLEEMATTDPMTGLFNKRALEQEFERRLRSAARFGKKLAVLVTDVDKFKSVNDTYGHAVGDQVIKGLGAILAKCKRDTDAVARFGGEEFVFVCEETDTEGAYSLAERIRTELAKTVFATEMGPLSVTCSLGVAEFPRDGETREELFHRADEALYDAKRNGRNQTCIAGRRQPPARKEPVRGERSSRTERAGDAPKTAPRRVVNGM